MTKIKICGITNIEDAKAADRAWAVGFIFVENSQRYISPEKAGEITRQLPENIEKVGVFANKEISEVVKASKQTGITAIQLHGDESPQYCTEIAKKTGLKVIKALRVRNESDIDKIQLYKRCVFAILLDAYCEKELGGTGKSFNWEIAVKAKDYGMPVILAGGLNPNNIKEAQETVNPYAFDVSSGVEAGKGIKDHSKIQELFEILHV